MENQIILIDKPAGISSFGVVAKVRGRLKAELGHKVKVGHTGTLDPFATGLLILLTGKMTKKSGDFLKLDKEYVAELKLGYTSSTGDPEGEIAEVISPKHSETSPKERLSDSSNSYNIPDGQIQTSLVKDISEPGKARISAISPVATGEIDACPKLSDVEFALESFIGKITQKVPAFSAVKINGERAYKLARAGKNFETPTREVTVYGIEVLEYNYPTLKIRCKVSSGTYIRTLAEDIGKSLGTGAYLTALRRTKIGKYDIKDASVI